MYLHSCVFLHFYFFSVDKCFLFHEQSGFIRNYRMGALLKTRRRTTVFDQCWLLSVLVYRSTMPECIARGNMP